MTLISSYNENRPPGVSERAVKKLDLIQADLSKFEQAKVFLPSRVQHFLYLLVDKFTVFRLDYEEVVPLRSSDEF